MLFLFSGQRVPTRQTRKNLVLCKTLSASHLDSLVALTSIKALPVATTFFLLYSARELSMSQNGGSSKQ